ncbi:uncharacterized protein LOC135495757 isoform X2 [Lineus longissimus]|uniref:uncharacterized protein LOC135495757 isoform X2 n=1 Tax=Lineus longissimus TaxID=88925 RepID=UPI00315D8B3E
MRQCIKGLMAKSVAVLGGGAAGLCALRHLVNKPKVFNRVVAYEQASQVGGTWVYTEKVGKDEHGLPVMSSMYRNLRTNLPKEVMAFPGYPFPKEWPSFMTHQQVLQYLEDFAVHYKLKEHIEFDTIVEKVHPIQFDGKTKWEIHTRNTIDGKDQTTREEFDAVFVCSGHFSEPMIPDIPSQALFQGDLSHSHDYRYPEPFTDKVVLFLGAGPSGIDIALDIAPVAKTVILCHNKPALQSLLPANVVQKPGIKAITRTGVTLLNDENIEIDALMFCTGYKYTYPFLSSDCHLEIQDGRVMPLYKHVIHTEHPSLFFVGICQTICPFPMFHMQVLFAVASLDGTMKLPTKAVMDQDIMKDYRWRISELDWPHRYAHKMGEHQWAYNNSLAELAGLRKVPRVVESLYDHVHHIRTIQVCEYKEHNYELIDDEHFKTVEN